MTAPLSRTTLSSMPLARMSGHRHGYRVLNGEVPGMSRAEQDFRYRMHELSGETHRLELLEEACAAYAAGLEDLWNHVADLHGYMRQSSRMDQLLTMLMQCRRVWRAKRMPHQELSALQDCLGLMATAAHDTKLIRSLSQRLLDAGVDVNQGF